MVFFRLLTLCIVLFCSACNLFETELESLNGHWICDGSATVALLPDSTYGNDTDRLNAAKIFDSMKIKFDPEARIIRLELGNRRETLPYDMLQSDQSDSDTLWLMADDTLAIEKQPDGTLLIFDPVEDHKKLVFKKIFQD